MAVIETVALGPVWNEGWRLSHSGDYRAAEHIFQLVLDKRAGAFGPNSTEVARTNHALGEQQLRLGQLAEAEANLKHAHEIRAASSRVSAFDVAASRESLAHVLEAQGNLEGAKEVRKGSVTKSLACSNYKCPGRTFSLSQIKTCGACR
ncbi:hypothetical protein FRC02_005787, partial [Tulasnella sp. 418]